MTPLQELSDLLSGRARVIVISEKNVDLRENGENRILVLKMVEGSLAAGGRGGGFGERKVTRVFLFRCGGGNCEKVFETEDKPKLDAFEVPFYVTRLPFTLADGTEGVGYGVVDPQLVTEYSKLTV